MRSRFGDNDKLAALAAVLLKSRYINYRKPRMEFILNRQSMIKLPKQLH
jgi:hypothetical protein